MLLEIVAFGQVTQVLLQGVAVGSGATIVIRSHRKPTGTGYTAIQHVLLCAGEQRPILDFLAQPLLGGSISGQPNF